MAVMVDQVDSDDLNEGRAVTQGCATDDTSLSFVIVDVSTDRDIAQGVIQVMNSLLIMMTLRR